MTDTDLRQALAWVQHNIWSHWMRHLFEVSHLNDDNTVTIPSEKVGCWKRQMEADYFDLPEEERESDQFQADKIIYFLYRNWGDDDIGNQAG